MNLVLFINGQLGLKILNYLSQHKQHTINTIFLNSDAKRPSNYIAEIESLIKEKNLRPSIVRWDSEAFQIENFGVDLEQPIFGVSALFGHILPEEMIGKFSGGILNLHPSLLPVGRGADPIPWSIIERQPQGITLHLISKQLDSGDIVFQREISTTLDMSAGDIYEIATTELFNEFSRCFLKWVNGEIILSPQGSVNVSQHQSSELASLQIIKEDEGGTFGEFVRRLQATTFSNGRRPLFKDNMGKIWEVTFSISDLKISSSEDNSDARE